MEGVYRYVFADQTKQPVIVGYWEGSNTVTFTEQEQSEVAAASDPDAKASEIFHSQYKTLTVIPNP
jgi:hypothetical protein